MRFIVASNTTDPLMARVNHRRIRGQAGAATSSPVVFGEGGFVSGAGCGCSAVDNFSRRQAHTEPSMANTAKPADQADVCVCNRRNRSNTNGYDSKASSDPAFETA